MTYRSKSESVFTPDAKAVVIELMFGDGGVPCLSPMQEVTWRGLEVFPVSCDADDGSVLVDVPVQRFMTTEEYRRDREYQVIGGVLYNLVAEDEDGCLTYEPVTRLVVSCSELVVTNAERL